MVKFKLTPIITILFTCSATLTSKAQIGYDYAKYDIGIAMDANRFPISILKPTVPQSIHLNFNYNQTPFVNYILEIQLGNLTDYYRGQLAGPFGAVSFRAQLQAGEFIDYSHTNVDNGFKNFYVSTGIGMVYNGIQSPDINAIAGENNGHEIFIPARIGYEFKFFNKFYEPSVKLDLGYQLNFVLRDDLTGFKITQRTNAFTLITMGVKFALGDNVTSSSKKIRY